MYTWPCAVCTVYCALCNVRCEVCSVPCEVCSAKCAVFIYCAQSEVFGHSVCSVQYHVQDYCVLVVCTILAVYQVFPNIHLPFNDGSLVFRGCSANSVVINLLHNIKTFADCQDSCRLLRQLMTVTDCKGIWKLLQTFADMFVLICSVRQSVSLALMGGAMTMACLSGKGHGKNILFDAIHSNVVPVKCIIGSAVEYSAVQFSSLQYSDASRIHNNTVQCYEVQYCCSISVRTRWGIPVDRRPFPMKLHQAKSPHSAIFWMF